jgi:hypothetical protein
MTLSEDTKLQWEEKKIVYQFVYFCIVFSSHVGIGF